MIICGKDTSIKKPKSIYITLIFELIDSDCFLFKKEVILHNSTLYCFMKQDYVYGLPNYIIFQSKLYSENKLNQI